jgi:hypothetical protein
MPLRWKPWLLTLLFANMILPWFYISRLEAQVILGVALLNGATFVVLTAISGFTRLIWLAHVYWIPLVYFLWSRLDRIPCDDIYGFWIRAVIVVNALALVHDATNVIRYLAGDRSEMVAGLGDDGREPKQD